MSEINYYDKWKTKKTPWRQNVDNVRQIYRRQLEQYTVETGQKADESSYASLNQIRKWF